MTMGWHMVMEFVPSLVGCLISSGNHSYELVSRSKECVINIPTVELAPIGRQDRQLLGRQRRQVRQVQAHRGRPPSKVKAPLIAECYANLECKLVDGRLRDKYNFFIFEVVKAHAPRRAEISQDHPLPRRRHVHGGGPLAQSAPFFQARDALTASAHPLIRPVFPATCAP